MCMLFWTWTLTDRSLAHIDDIARSDIVIGGTALCAAIDFVWRFIGFVSYLFFNYINLVYKPSIIRDWHDFELVIRRISLFSTILCVLIVLGHLSGVLLVCSFFHLPNIMDQGAIIPMDRLRTNIFAIPITCNHQVVCPNHIIPCFAIYHQYSSPHIFYINIKCFPNSRSRMEFVADKPFLLYIHYTKPRSANVTYAAAKLMERTSTMYAHTKVRK